MVTTNDQSRERKDATTKAISSSSKKAAVVAGVWPCHITGCGKQFAREADLKRHQRTTKFHSMPGHQCPQCDATFTRTDALRRHQKSRHSGVVFNQPEEEPMPSPPLKSQPLPTTQPSASPAATVSPATGHASYYRQHTALTTSYIPQYAQISLPTSATRLNSATNWTQSSPWTGSMSYSHPPVYSSHTPYYRPHIEFDAPPESPTEANGSHPSSPQQVEPESESRLGTPQNDSSSSHSDPQTPDAAAADGDAPLMTEDQIRELSRQLSPGTIEAMFKGVKVPETRDLSFHWQEERSGYKPMEHMLTEDGEPMLNPAELLTQESLASPPPS